tara:strand:- start:133 stop:426 length:294 start_codon:yes stop_codon:yes gene_type:complete
MIAEVLSWKFKDQAGMRTKDGEIVDFPGGIPSQEDQDLWTAEYNDYLAATQYKEQRAKAYKPLAEQLDMQYWDKVNGTDTWKEHIDAVKAAHPKGDE